MSSGAHSFLTAAIAKTKQLREAKWTNYEVYSLHLCQTTKKKYATKEKKIMQCHEYKESVVLNDLIKKCTKCFKQKWYFWCCVNLVHEK